MSPVCTEPTRSCCICTIRKPPTRPLRTLAETLSHLAAQGVPFTGQVGSTGIVSRGVDHGGTSWRALVCRSLAEALWAGRAVAGSTAAPTDVADLALERLADLGFDVETWRPQPVATGAIR